MCYCLVFQITLPSKKKLYQKNVDFLSCTALNRYKIYIEGSAWSVSEKYILACDSVALLVKPLYYDFFSRSLMPTQHYWPVRQDDKCRSIKFAVEWGNNHMQKVTFVTKLLICWLLVRKF